MVALLICLNVLSLLQLVGIAVIIYLIKSRKIQPTPPPDQKPTNHKPVLLTAEHERKLVNRMTEGDQYCAGYYEDIW